MFVIINSTTTRINKSHLVDLYEQVSWAEPDRRFSALITDLMYSEADSPLRYRINRLGGRSKQEKWILQAELFNEIHRWVKRIWRQVEAAGADKRLAARYYAIVRDFLKAAAAGVGGGLGQSRLHGHQAGDPQGDVARVRRLATPDADPEDGRVPALDAGGWPMGAADRFSQRGLLRAVPGQGPGGTRGAHPPGAGAERQREREGRPGKRGCPGEWPGLTIMPFGNSELESQRDSIVQPRVATEELPWVNAPTMTYPNGVASSHRFPANLNFRKALGLTRLNRIHAVIDLFNPNSEVRAEIERPCRAPSVVGRVTLCAPRLPPGRTKYPQRRLPNPLLISVYPCSPAPTSHFGVRV